MIDKFLNLLFVISKVVWKKPVTNNHWFGDLTVLCRHNTHGSLALVSFSQKSILQRGNSPVSGQHYAGHWPVGHRADGCWLRVFVRKRHIAYIRYHSWCTMMIENKQIRQLDFRKPLITSIPSSNPYRGQITSNLFVPVFGSQQLLRYVFKYYNLISLLLGNSM